VRLQKRAPVNAPIKKTIDPWTRLFMMSDEDHRNFLHCENKLINEEIQRLLSTQEGNWMYVLPVEINILMGSFPGNGKRKAIQDLIDVSKFAECHHLVISYTWNKELHTIVVHEPRNTKR
jgi:hypothetical protein